MSNDREERRRPRAIELPEDLQRRRDERDARDEPLATPFADPPKADPIHHARTEADAAPRRRSPQAVDPARVEFEPDAFAREAEAVLQLDPVPLPPERRRGWLGIALSSLMALVGIAIGLWVESLIGRLFELAPWAGAIGLALAIAFVVSILALALRELLAIRRLSTRADLRARAEAARLANDDRAARGMAKELVAAFDARPETAAGRATLAATADDVMDARDRLSLVESELLAPLDLEARRVILGSAKRVSLVTAVAPRAFIDIAYVLIENARAVRAIANIYGIRPGRLGFLRLMRDVVSHLAVTGAIAVGDSVVGEAFGHGIASRVSSRFGEGVVNGLLTTRIGISAMDLCRPLPFHDTKRPNVSDIARDLVRISGPRT